MHGKRFTGNPPGVKRWKSEQENTGNVKLDMSKLGAKELKDLDQAVQEEQKRRGKKNPARHDPPVWTIPNEALAQSGKSSAAA